MMRSSKEDIVWCESCRVGELICCVKQVELSKSASSSYILLGEMHPHSNTESFVFLPFTFTVAVPSSYMAFITDTILHPHPNISDACICIHNCVCICICVCVCVCIYMCDWFVFYFWDRKRKEYRVEGVTEMTGRGVDQELWHTKEEETGASPAIREWGGYEKISVLSLCTLSFSFTCMHGNFKICILFNR